MNLPSLLQLALPALAALAAAAVPAAAQGLHAVDGGPGANLHGLRLTEMQVRGRVQDRVATTELRQTFANESGGVREAIWLLPLPEAATADGFAMTVNGQRMESEVLDAAGARRIYEQIVRRRRDPGLLEYAGRGCLRARVFPIPPQGEVLVEVRYRQILPNSGGLYQWTFPLRSMLVAGQTPDRLSLDLRITAGQPIRTVYTPMSDVEIARKGEREARVSFESEGAAARSDLDVFFGLEERDFGLNLLTWRKGEEPGYFLMTLSPKQDWPAFDDVHRVVQFVVDTSGSMKGKKIEQAKAALRYFVRSLQETDWFNVIAFSTEARPLFESVQPSRRQARRKEALDWVDALQARGGTNIEEALRAALAAEVPDIPGKDAQVVPLTVFLTDGLPTVGVTNEQELVALTEKHNPLDQRVFVFGVGHDLDTHLLDRIAEQTGGSRDYVREDEDIEVKTSALFDRLSHPVMTDLELSCEGAEFERVHPKNLPDLFRGDQIVLLGRYRDPGHHAVRLRGTLVGEKREFVYESTFADEDRTHDFIAPLWAERRVAVLLDALRLNGHDRELVEEVTRLGREFAIVTPYTAHLVLEDGAVARGGPSPAPSGPATPGAGGGAAPSGPTSPGPAGPTTGGRPGGTYRGPGDAIPSGIATGSDAFFMGRGAKKPTTSLANLLLDLRRAGALPKDADEKSLRRLMLRIGTELQDADRRLRRLGQSVSGEEAVDGSVYLARMLANRRGGGERAIVSLLTRRVGEFSLRLRAGVWTDVAYAGEAAEKEPREIEAFSDDYFRLLKEHPELAPVLAFSTHVLIVVDGEPIRIRAPKDDETSEEHREKTIR